MITIVSVITAAKAAQQQSRAMSSLKDAASQQLKQLQHLREARVDVCAELQIKVQITGASAGLALQLCEQPAHEHGQLHDQGCDQVREHCFLPGVKNCDTNVIFKNCDSQIFDSQSVNQGDSQIW